MQEKRWIYKKQLDKYQLLTTFRGRIEIDTHTTSKDKEKTPIKKTPYGIEKLPLSECKFFHSSKRALDMFQPDLNSPFAQRLISKYEIPYVAGVSGHTWNMLTGAQMLLDEKQFSKAQLFEYTLACFAALTSGGNHSLYEVMMIAEYYELFRDNTPLSLNLHSKETLGEEFFNIFQKFLEQLEEFYIPKLQDGIDLFKKNIKK